MWRPLLLESPDPSSKIGAAGRLHCDPRVQARLVHADVRALRRTNARPLGWPSGSIRRQPGAISSGRDSKVRQRARRDAPSRILRASAAPKIRPLKASSIARRSPMAATTERKIRKGHRPMRISVSPKVASSAATTMWHSPPVPCLRPGLRHGPRRSAACPCQTNGGEKALVQIG